MKLYKEPIMGSGKWELSSNYFSNITEEKENIFALHIKLTKHFLWWQYVEINHLLEKSPSCKNNWKINPNIQR